MRQQDYSDDFVTTETCGIARQPELAWQPGGLAYGGDWNPEQWDADTVAEDMRLMQQAGVNLVTLGVFSWARTEPREGTYDFQWLVDIMDQLHEHGIGVDLATGTASPPAWMAADHPDSLPVDRAGNTLGFGSRQQYSPASSYYRQKAAALARNLAEAVKGHPALKMWHINNEYGCHVFESFRPQDIAAFRDWLRQRYRTLECLNETWGTDFWSQVYTRWDHIGAPTNLPALHNPAQLRDWKRFWSDQMLHCYLAEARELRRVTPNIPITTNFMGLFPHADYWKWAKYVDVLSDDSYPDPADPTAAHQVAFEADLMRCLGGNRPFLLMEQTTRGVQWRSHNAVKRPGQFRLWSLSRIAHGSDGAMQFQWRASRAGAEAFHSAMVPHAGIDTATWSDVCGLGADLHRLGEIVGTSPRNRVGIMLDWDTQWASRAAFLPAPADHFLAVRRWHRTFWEAGYGVDVLSADADLSGYDIVVLPSLAALPDEDEALAARLHAAAAAGTSIIMDGPTGLMTPNMHALLGGYGGALARLAGVRVVDHVSPSPAPADAWQQEPVRPRLDRITGAVAVPSRNAEVTLAVNPDTPLGQVANASGFDEGWCYGRTWAALIEVTGEGYGEGDTRVLGRYANRGAASDYAGQPALTARVVQAEGKPAGTVVFSATELGAYGRDAVATLLAQSRGIRPVGGASPDAGVECVQRGPIRFYLNHSDREVVVAQADRSQRVLAGGWSGEGEGQGEESCVLGPLGAVVLRVEE